MKISEVTVTELKAYANVYHDEDDSLFNGILLAAKAFIKAYTGLPYEASVDNPEEDNLDNHDDLTIALFIISNEMYDNRMVTVESNKVGFVVKQLLDSHSVNLL